jgi:hypothetical protein
MTGWNEGMGATIPVVKDGKLYGRGGADDGYSTYSTMLAIKSLQQQNIPTPSTKLINFRMRYDYLRRLGKWQWSYAPLLRNFGKKNWNSLNMFLLR